MKKQFILFLIAFTSFTAKSQITGYTHNLSLSNSSYFYLGGNELFIAGKFNQFGRNENYLLDYNLTDNTFEYINDSLPSISFYNLTGYIGNNMIALNKLNNPDTLLFTTNKWQTFGKISRTYFSANKFTNAIKTSFGFLIVAEDFGNAFTYYSPDGQNWGTTATTLGAIGNSNPMKSYLKEVDGKTFFFQRTDLFRISYDGGQTFINKSGVGGQGNLNKVLVIDTNTIIAYRNANPYANYDFHYSTNGGLNWQAMNLNDQLFYVKGLDSLFFLQGQDSLFLSTDTGVTKTFYSTNIPPNFTYFAQVFNSRDSGMLVNNNEYFSPHIDSAWKFLGTSIFGGRSIDFNQNAGFIDFSYTTSGGKIFTTKPANVSLANQIEACKVLNDSTVLFTDSDGDIYKTIDQGDTWVKKLNIGTGYAPIGRKFYQLNNGDTLMLTNYDFRAKYSLNKGETWQNMTAGGGAFAFSMTPKGTVYQAVDDYINNAVQIAIYSNTDVTAPATLVNTINEDSLKVVVMEMFDENIGYILARHQTANKLQLFKTNDAWTSSISLGSILNLTTKYGVFNGSFNGEFKYKIHLPSADTVYLNKLSLITEDSNSNSLYYSYDGGLNWNESEIKYSKYQQSPNERINDIYFFNATSFISTSTFGRVFYNSLIAANSGGNGNPTSIKTVELNNDFNVYPNPTNDYLNIDYGDEQFEEVIVYNLAGKTMLRSQNRKQLNVSELTNGTYVIEVSTKTNRAAKLFIKQ